MRRPHPSPQMNVPISMEIYHQLLGASADARYEKEDWEIAAEAIHEWMRRHKPDAIPMPVTKGYQWKRLFLPDGTLLRTVFKGKNHHCLVEGDQLLYNGKPVSPSGFVNAVGGIRRNAWRCTWVLLPETRQWKLADSLRTRERTRRECKPPGVSQQATSRLSVPVPAAPEVSDQATLTTVHAGQAATIDSEDLRSQNTRRDDGSASGAMGDPLTLQRRDAPQQWPTRRKHSGDRRSGSVDRMSAVHCEDLFSLLAQFSTHNADRRKARAGPIA